MMDDNNCSFNVEKFVKKDIENVWKKYREYYFSKYPPVTVKRIPCNSIIFIGLNPSLSKINLENIKNNSNLKLESYELSSNKEENHRYFYKFADIAGKLHQKWGHIDLLYYRNTRQKNIENMLRKTEKPESNFITCQFKVANKLINTIIEKAKPKLFVVNNALVRRILFQDLKQKKKTNIWTKTDFVWNENIGTYNFKKIPFYFTSMLTGQRALDNGSLERLIWQIELFTNKEKM